MMVVETFPGKIPAASAGVDFSVSHFPPCNEFGRICGVHDSGLSVSDWMDGCLSFLYFNRILSLLFLKHLFKQSIFLLPTHVS